MFSIGHRSEPISASLRLDSLNLLIDVRIGATVGATVPSETLDLRFHMASLPEGRTLDAPDAA